ncbi:MAG TPA: NAD(P)H-dependent oxidoreductase [Pararhizobium sp.]|nr:NAD(P)H-dependent oxidoreductase [Pararhizobium sp.]
MPLKLHTLVCSTRPTRIGPSIANWFHAYAQNEGSFDATLVDLADFDLPVLDEPKHPRLREYEHEHTRRWSESVAEADAFVFVAPEYNYGPTPALLNALNYLVKEWNYKPVGFVSYGGVSGGLRGAQSIKTVLTTLKLMPIPEGVAVPFAQSMIGEDKIFQPTELMEQGAGVMLKELHRISEALKGLRQG